MKSIQNLPYGKRWRELWEARNVNSTNLPSSVASGHPLTLTGAVKKTTANGIHFAAGVATSNVKFADPYDAAADWWASFRFKLDENFSSASSTDMYLIGKYVDATNYLVVYLRASDGKICFDHTEGGATEDVVTAEVSWSAGTWYHVLVSKNNTNTKQRIRVDGGTAVEEANGTAISLIADICIGARDDGVSTEGFAGIIDDVAMGNDTLSDDEEIALYNNVAPVDVVNLFKFSEGRGTTANDRGSGADNATLDSSCEWSFDSVRRVTLSFDGIDDRAISAASACDITGSNTVVFVCKESVSWGTDANTKMWWHFDEDGGGNSFIYYEGTTQKITALIGGVTADFTPSNSVDDYSIYVVVIDDVNATLSVYLNGTLKSTASSLAKRDSGKSRLYIGENGGIQKASIEPMVMGQIEGALTTIEVREFSKWLNRQLNLGLSI